MTQDTPDFASTEYAQTTATGAAFLDANISDLLASIDSLVVSNATIANATLSVDLPPRFRTGVPRFLENFEYNRGVWQPGTAGTGAASVRSTAISYSKGASWLLTPGSDGARNASAAAHFGRLPLTEVGLQLCFTVPTNLTYFRTWIYFPYGEDALRCMLDIDFGTNVVIVWRSGAAYETAFDDHEWHVGEDAFHFLKFTVDTDQRMWGSVFLDDQEADMSSYELVPEAGSTGKGASVYIYCTSSAGNNPDCYVDDILVTEE